MSGTMVRGNVPVLRSNHSTNTLCHNVSFPSCYDKYDQKAEYSAARDSISVK